MVGAAERHLDLFARETNIDLASANLLLDLRRPRVEIGLVTRDSGLHGGAAGDQERSDRENQVTKSGFHGGD